MSTQSLIGDEIVLAEGRFTDVDGRGRLVDLRRAYGRDARRAQGAAPEIARWFEGWKEPELRPLYLVNPIS